MFNVFNSYLRTATRNDDWRTPSSVSVPPRPTRSETDARTEDNRRRRRGFRLSGWL